MTVTWGMRFLYNSNIRLMGCAWGFDILRPVIVSGFRSSVSYPWPPVVCGVIWSLITFPLVIPWPFCNSNTYLNTNHPCQQLLKFKWSVPTTSLKLMGLHSSHQYHDIGIQITDKINRLLINKIINRWLINKRQFSDFLLWFLCNFFLKMSIS